MRQTPFGRARSWVASPVGAVGFALSVALVAIVLIWTASYVVSGVSSRRVDDRLNAAAGAAPAILDTRLQAASQRAVALAGAPKVVHAIVVRDTAALQRIAARRRVVFEVGGGTIGDVPPAGSPSRDVVVYRGSKPIGRIVAPVRIDRSFVERVAAAARLHRRDVLYVATGRHVATTTSSNASPAPALPAHARVVRRTLFHTSPPTVLVAGGRAWRGVPGFLIAALGILAFAVGLVFFRVRQPYMATPRRAVRAAVSLVGETLAATHNPQALLSVMLESAIEATNAAGGALFRAGKRIDERGDSLVGERLQIDFRDAFDDSMLTMVLAAGDGSFTKDAREAAEWITAQAAIALENAHLHQLVQEQAVTDELTGLANRRQFLDALAHELARSARTGETTSLVFCDLDDFKRVNDRYGHATGDEVLRVVGRVLRESVRELDVPARLGGEEFAVVLPNTALDGAVKLAERIRTAVDGAVIFAGGHRIQVSVSLGVTTHRLGQTLEELMHEADQCLYAAKAAGKNTVVGRPSPAPEEPGEPRAAMRRSSP